MPFGIHKHSNRSKQALNDQSVHPNSQGNPSSAGISASSASASEGASIQPNPNGFASADRDDNNHHHQRPPPQDHHLQQQQHPLPPPPTDDQPYTQAVSAVSESSDPRSFQHSAGPPPARSQSTRYSTGAYPPQNQQHHQQPYQHQGLQSQFGGSVDNLLIDQHQQYLHSQQQQQLYGQPQQLQQQPQSSRVSAPAPPPAEQQKKSKSIFDRMRAGRDNRLSQELKSPPPSSTNNSGLSRRLSKRQDNPPAIRTAQQQQQQQSSPLEDRSLHSARQSRSQLPSPEEERHDIDPFQIQESDQTYPHHSPQEIGQHPTIRAVVNEQESSAYTQNEEDHSQFAPVPPPHSPHVNYHLQPESSGQGQYEIQNRTPPHQNHNLQPGFNFSHDYHRQPNPETVSQLSHDSPTEQVQEQQRPTSVHSNGQSPTSFTNRSQYPDRTTSIQGSLQAARPLSEATAPMGPPAGSSQQNRRSNTDSKSLQGMIPGQPESRDGSSAPPGYTRGQTFPGNQTQPPGGNPQPSAVGTQGQGANYRGGPPQRDQYGNAGGGEQGRSTPPPQPAGQDVNELYKELQIKYKKVKGLYFDKQAQVEQLQNTLANQRLSQSRTSLDDSEYMARFQRLDGAAINLAFNIRKDWRTVPGWVAHSVNQDALKIGKQEMTAVGRACIAKFLVEHIFNKTFHPGLETGLSSSLKTIEQNIRRFSPILNNQEESDALTAKVVQWRLATLEGLKDVLNSPECDEHRRDFSRAATTNLTAELINYLQDAVPPGIEDFAHQIVELAVSIASNLPLESRDISISYPLPGDHLQPFLMKVETAVIPPLENPGADCDEIDNSSTGSLGVDDGQKENEKSGKLHKEKTKSGGMMQAIMGGSGAAGKRSSANTQSEGLPEPKSKSSEDGSQKVRFAGFIGVEVKGRQVLCKAPVWTLG